MYSIIKMASKIYGRVKWYTLREGHKDTKHIFKGSAPRRAALKAATRGFRDIRLRAHKRKKDKMWRVHVFEGWVEKVPKRADAPGWLPDMINEPNVRKIGVDKLKKI